MPRQDPSVKRYYFIDVDLYSRQIVSWDTETQDKVDVGDLTNGCYRVFLSKGQYNKLVQRLSDARE